MVFQPFSLSVLCSRTLSLVSGFLLLHKKSVLSLKFNFLGENSMDILIFQNSLNHSHPSPTPPPPKINFYFLYSNTMTLVPLNLSKIGKMPLKSVNKFWRQLITTLNSIITYSASCSMLESHITQADLLESHQACHIPKWKCKVSSCAIFNLTA